MDEYAHQQGPLPDRAVTGAREAGALPRVSDAEREFWRRAVAVERARRRCGRPAPFPFQDA